MSLEYKTYDEVLSMLILSKIFNENSAFNDFQKKVIINEIKKNSPFTLDNVTREKFFEFVKRETLTEEEKTFLCNHFRKYFNFEQYKPTLFEDLQEMYKEYERSLQSS